MLDFVNMLVFGLRCGAVSFVDETKGEEMWRKHAYPDDPKGVAVATSSDGSCVASADKNHAQWNLWNSVDGMMRTVQPVHNGRGNCTCHGSATA